jgi:hypothetical protein
MNTSPALEQSDHHVVAGIDWDPGRRQRYRGNARLVARAIAILI